MKGSRFTEAQIITILCEAETGTLTIEALFRGPTINQDRIRMHWDDMHRVAASLQDGTVTAQLFVSKPSNS